MKRKPNEEVAREILDYFLRNPEAADSLAEIARWRIREETIHRSVESTQNALEWLTDKGYLNEVSLQGVAPVFRLDPAKRKDAERFIHSAQTNRGLRKDSG